MLGRQARLPLAVDGRAPLPRGVLALLEPRGALRRDRRAHAEPPHRLRRAARARSRTTTPCARPESAAVLDLLSATAASSSARDARARASSSRASASTPNQTREMWQEAVGHIVDVLDRTTRPSSRASTGQLPQPPRAAEAAAEAASAACGARPGSPDGHRMMGELGLGLLSFSVGTPPEELKKRVDIYRAGIAACTKPLGKFVNDRAACFTMVNCAPTREESYAVSQRLVRVVCEALGGAGRLGADLARGDEGEADGTYDYLDDRTAGRGPAPARAGLARRAARA